MSDQETPNETEHQTDQLEEEGAEHEETEPETDDGQEVEPSEESELDPEREQAGAATPAPVATSPGGKDSSTSAQTVTWKEDPNDFDESTIEIGITLHPLKGRPAEERLVTFCIHNHSGPPVTSYYTQGELTNESPLDRLLWAIAQEIKKFRGELSRRKQEQFERDEQARRTRREHKSATPARVGTPATVATTQATPGEHAAPGVKEEERTASPAPVVATTSPALASAKTAKQGNELVQQPLF